MDDLSLINNTAVYRTPAAQSPLQGANVMQPAAVYSKIMLKTIELAESDYVFDGLAQERTMPSNNGANEIVFKRMLSLAAHTQPLVEGIPPASDKGSMVAIKASTKSYGRVMKFTDKVNWAVVDPLISEYTRQLSLKIPETKDILAQEALLAEASVFYAQPKKQPDEKDPDLWVVDGSKARVNHIKFLDTTCTPTIDEFRQIVLSAEAAKVRPYSGGNFLALVSSAVMFDLITDRRVKEFMHYAGTGRAYEQDVVIDLFSLMFKKAKTIKTDNTFIDGDGNVKYLFTVVAASDITITLSEKADEASGEITKIPAGAYTVVASEGVLADSSEIEIMIAGKAYVGKDGGSSVAQLTWADVKSGLTYDKLNVHHSLVIGEEALFRVGVEGHTAPQFIKKELGSAGTEDPLNQRQSIGWKIDSLGYKVVNPDAVIDYMSIPSQYRVNVHARPDFKNEFTDYFYGFKDASGNYYHPEEVTEFGGVYKVRGKDVTVTPVKMTELVKPINGGRIGESGKKPVARGDVPTLQFALKSNKAVRFLKEQVEFYETDSKWYIKGLAGTASAEVIEIEPNGIVYEVSDIIASDGSEKGLSGEAFVEHGDVNKLK